MVGFGIVHDGFEELLEPGGGMMTLRLEYDSQVEVLGVLSSLVGYI